MVFKTAFTLGVTFLATLLVAIRADAQQLTQGTADAQVAPDNADDLSGPTTPGNEQNGFHLFSATLSSGYSSSLGSLGASWTPAANSSIFYEGASLLFGYTHVSTRSTLNIEYSPSYSALNGAGGLRFLNQNLSVGYSRRYGARWAIGLSGQASDYTFVDVLFPNRFSDSFSGISPVAAGSGTFGSIGPPIPASFVGDRLPLTLPQAFPFGDRLAILPQAFLFGDRQLMYSGRIGFEYKPSNRLSISMDTGAFQIEALDRNNYTLNAIVPWARSEEFNVGVTYDASTRTEFQTVLLTSETQSPFSSYVITSISESVRRKITPHWQVFLQGGGVYLAYLQSERAPAITTYLADAGYLAYLQSERTPAMTSYLAGGGSNYSGRANTMGFTFTRAVGDSLGIASGSTWDLQGFWKWHRPGSSWSVDASAVDQRLNGGELGNFSLWQASAAITRALSDRTWVRIEYTWLRDTSIPYGFTAKPQAHGVKLTFGWNAAAFGPQGLPGSVSSSSAVR